MAPQALNSSQLHALLDILSHHEVYTEIQDFRAPGTLSDYGPPFRIEAAKPSNSPSLQTLVSRFVTTLPGLRDVSTTFWQQGVLDIIEKFEAAELSESYDRGSLGIRKTLATAISALIEYPVRGVFAGFEEPAPKDALHEYDTSKADDLSRAFSDFMHQAVYGDMIDQLFNKAAETDNLTDHALIMQAAHEYILVNLASILHYTLILSPKGQNLLTLIDHANKLIPYAIIKQTLKIGNVASMINAMMKVILAKMSMGSVTNWIGWTQSADEGMNLLEQIINQVLNYDIRDLKTRAARIEKDRDSPTKEQLGALKAYVVQSREEHEGIRQMSHWQSQSIVSVIFEAADIDVSNFSDTNHAKAQDYLAIQLSIRDREQIIKVLCHGQPDFLTQIIRESVTAYEPIIRSIHNAVDLSDTLTDFEHFLKDMIKLAKIPISSKTTLVPHHNHLHRQATDKDPDFPIFPKPTVGDFVQLLRKHQSSLHKFLHQVAQNGKEVTSWYHEYVITAASHFRRSPDKSVSSDDIDFGIGTLATGGAGSLTIPLTTLFNALPSQEQKTICPILDVHAKYLRKLHVDSAARLASTLASAPTHMPLQKRSTFPLSRSSSPARSQGISTPRGSQPGTPGSQSPVPFATSHSAAAADSAGPAPGPGAYLAHWQALLDSTPLTPAESAGPVRHGGTNDVKSTSSVDVEGKEKAMGLIASDVGNGATEAPLLAEVRKESGKGKSSRVSAEESTLGGGREEDKDEMRDLKIEDGQRNTEAHDMRPVVDALLPAFREMLAKQTCSW